jgi:hypothetical protein
MPKLPTDYSRTVIYKICCNDINITDIYVGHTTDLIKRRCSHKCNCNNPNKKKYNIYVYQFIRDNGGWDNWSVTPIEEYKCDTPLQARIREQYWIENIEENKLNTNNAVMNKELKAKYQKEYDAVNKDKKAKYNEEYYNENKDKLVAYRVINKDRMVEYRAMNKDRIAENKKQYYIKNKDRLAEYRAINKERIAENNKKYYIKNREKILERKKLIELNLKNTQQKF